MTIRTLPALLVLWLLPLFALAAGADEPSPRRLEGEIAGARWAALVPENWSGRLLLEAPDRRPAPLPPVAELDAAAPDHQALLAAGWALATTSYRRSGTILVDAIEDLRALRGQLALEIGPAKTTIVAGTGMGGLVATLMAERHADEFNAFLAIDPRFDLRDPRALRLRCDQQPRAPLLFLFGPATTAGAIEYRDRAGVVANAESYVPVLWFQAPRDEHDPATAGAGLPAALEALVAWLQTREPPASRLDDLPAANEAGPETVAPPAAEEKPAEPTPLPDEPPPTVPVDGAPAAR